MIELKISNDAAVLLLTDRMRYEIGMRVKANILSPDKALMELEYSELIKIAETSAFDLLIMLPADLLTRKTNLIEIVNNSMRSLASIFHKAEFNDYSFGRAAGLVRMARNIIDIGDKEMKYLVN